MASGERQGQLWSAAPRDWAELQEPFCRPLWQDTLSALGVRAGVRFLDAGCGGGGACVLAAALGCEVTGFDASNALLAVARERLPQAQFLHGDLENSRSLTGTLTPLWQPTPSSLRRTFGRQCASCAG